MEAWDFMNACGAQVKALFLVKFLFQFHFHRA
jgi:hypothetical protein